MNRLPSLIGPLIPAGLLLLHTSWSFGAEPAKFTLPPYTKHKLENGVTLLLMERHQLPLVNFVWIMKSGGSICDLEGREGLASLTAQLLRKGTKNRSSDQISEELDFVGASLGAGASQVRRPCDARIDHEGPRAAPTVDRDRDKNPVVALREIAEQTVRPAELQEAIVGGLQKILPDDEDEADEVGSLSQSAEALRITASAPARSTAIGCSSPGSNSARRSRPSSAAPALASACSPTR